MQNRSSSLARLLASSAAHLQHGMDQVIAWGFRSMKHAGEQKSPSKEPPTVLARGKTIGRGLLSFLGTVGEEYYKTYEELKQRERKR